MSNHWHVLHDELQQWEAPACLWWRDDDAVADTPALRQLIQLQSLNHPAAQQPTPLHLASIPKQLEPSLTPLIADSPSVYILQHGYNHQSNAREGQRNIELGGDQNTETLLIKLAEGKQILQQAFATCYVDILVPPWNRIEAAAEIALEQLGYLALSGLGLRSKKPYPFAQLNVHIDIIDWRQRQFKGTETCITQIVEQLRMRRLSCSDRTEPLGIMSHHLAHDRDCWDFLAALLLETSAHPNIRWLSAEEALRQ